jgi:hypothetical protein
MKRAHTPPAKAKTTTESAQPTTDQFQAQVRLRAYQLYERRGRQDGHELDDWLQAEAELVQKKAKGAGA